MGNWKEYKLGEICTKIGSGATPKGGKEAYLGGGTSLIRSQNVLDFSFSWDGLAYINDEQASKLKNVEIVKGDVLLNITGDSVARVCMVPDSVLPARVNQHVAIVRGEKEKVYNEYILYYLQYKKSYLLSLSQGGATRNALTKGMIEGLTIPLPEITKQKAIVEILKSLDDKIECNRRINENLEQQAQALFKSWFVDFEPFKDQTFVESELGMIPQGWRVEKIENLAEKIASGGTPKSLNREYYSGEIRWFSTKELKDCFLFDSEKHISSDGLNNSAAKLFPEGTILMAIYAAPTVGRLGILTKPSSFNQAAVGIVPKVTVGLEYLFLSLLSERINLNNLASGAAQQNLNVGIVKNYRIVIPPLDVLNKFNHIIHGVFEQIRITQQESRRLAELRDTLLPKLMSGELNVENVTF